MNTPVILITGFLGAGKTTFINYVLKNNPDKKISLILNEFGDIKLESQFIEEKGLGMVAELAGGCLCCVANVDLPRVIKYTLEKAPQTKYLLIEASGLSDPDPVRSTLQSDSLSSLIRLDTVIAIVDAENYLITSQDHPLVMSQIAEADLALISKAKSLAPAQLASLITRIANIGTGTRTLVWDDSFDSAIIFDPPIIPSHKESSPHHVHTNYEEFWYQSTQPHDLALLETVLGNLPDNILRVKGYTDDASSRYLLQKVGKHVDIRIGNSGGVQETVILVLGTSLDRANLNNLFSSTLKKV